MTLRPRRFNQDELRPDAVQALPSVIAKGPKTMARINATVTASDGQGNQVNLSISPNPISVPPGQHQIVITLDSQTNQQTTFDAEDPVYYANGHSCPSSGRNCAQLDVVSCTDAALTLADNNDAPNTIGYQLNFKTGNRPQRLDPIIINN